jgi:stringent starvation protein B
MPPSKREVMLALLEHAEAQVHLDARRDGVLLPAKLKASSNVRLDYGHGLVPPIPDLAVDEDGIRATLSFNRVPFATFVPWNAIFLIADFAGRGAVWREDLPPELVVQAEPARNTAGDEELAPPSPEPARRRLGVIDGDIQPAFAPDHGDRDGEPQPPRPRPALRLVK